jgi:hypothetical protein
MQRVRSDPVEGFDGVSAGQQMAGTEIDSKRNPKGRTLGVMDPSGRLVCHDRALRLRLVFLHTVILIFKLLLVASICLFLYFGSEISKPDDFFQYVSRSSKTPSLTRYAQGIIPYIAGGSVTGYGFDAGFIFMPAKCATNGTSIPESLRNFLWMQNKQKLQLPDANVWRSAVFMGAAVLASQVLGGGLTIWNIWRAAKPKIIDASVMERSIAAILSQLITILTGSSLIVIFRSLPPDFGLYIAAKTAAAIECDSYLDDATHTPTTLFELQDTRIRALKITMILGFVLSFGAILLRLFGERMILKYKVASELKLTFMDKVMKCILCV